MAQVICEVSTGRGNREKNVAVKDVFGKRRYLRVETDFLAKVDSKDYLPVGVAGIDHEKKMALIELPQESDSGARRIWVWLDTLQGLQQAAGAAT